MIKWHETKITNVCILWFIFNLLFCLLMDEEKKEEQIPSVVDKNDEDPVLYIRRNVSESSPSNYSVSDENGTRKTPADNESESVNNNVNQIESEIHSEKTSACTITLSNTQGTEEVLSNYETTGGIYSQVPNNSGNDKASVCTSKDNAARNAATEFVGNTVKNIDNEIWDIHAKDPNHSEIHHGTNKRLETNLAKTVIEGEVDSDSSVCSFFEANNTQEKIHIDRDDSVFVAAIKKQTKRGRLNRNVLKSSKKTHKKEFVGEKRSLKQLVHHVREKNGDSKNAKRREIDDKSKKVSLPTTIIEEKQSRFIKPGNSEACDGESPMEVDKRSHLLVKIAISKEITKEETQGTCGNEIGKMLPKKRKFKVFDEDENLNPDETKRKKKESKRKERRREQAKLLKEARLTKKEEKLRRERMKERQKELDERYLIIDEDIKSSSNDDGEKTEIPSETSAVPHIPVVKRYVLDENSDTKEVLIEIDPKLLAKLKPHQVEAVRFMYDCCIESIDKLHTSDGGGCILAHCMGLGKTLSVISFVYTLMSNMQLTGMQKCLIVCPLNTVKNWVNEFHKWTLDLVYKIQVFELSNIKDSKKRGELLNEWSNNGGVMILGYEMYRNLVQAGKGKVRVQKETHTDILANPGPDLVICDEGHILKNSKSLSYKAMNRIRTRRRVILTGTPLQNNLKEYYHMVNYVKPLLLSTMKNFQQRFIDPIMDGQCKDSSFEQIQRMKNRVHVLHKILGGCVQRKDYSALTKFLPAKHEYVISVRMGTKQCSLYETYLCLTGVDGIRKIMGRNARLFKDYQSLMKIWTHPWLLTQCTNKKDSKQKSSVEKETDQMDKLDSSQSQVPEKNASSVINEDQNVAPLAKDEGDSVKDQSNLSHDVKCEKYEGNLMVDKREIDGRGHAEGEVSVVDESLNEQKNINTEPTIEAIPGSDEESNSLIYIPERNQQENYDIEDIIGDWWKDYVTESDCLDAYLSGKIVLLNEILDMCRKCGDKLLVFSQSIPSLNLIESFLRRRNESLKGNSKRQTNMNTWVRDQDYFRIDGSTSAQKRKELQKSFNDPQNHRACLFLISTKAGSLGTNLVAANRVIIFDASWNPSHDIQSIFRVYRFGQIKQVYVYRFLAQGTMEEKIYERQVTKQSLSQRVIDEHQIERHFTQADLQALYRFTPDRLDDPDREDRPLPNLPKDDLLANLMTTQKDWIVTFHEHDSLLENIEEQELTEEEKKIAWEEYERKALHIYRPSELEMNIDDDQSEDSVKKMNSPETNDGFETLDSLPSISQVSLDQWFNQPEHTELLDTLRDLIVEKCPDVLMEGDENVHNATDEYQIRSDSYAEHDRANHYSYSVLIPENNSELDDTFQQTNLYNNILDLSKNNRGVLEDASNLDYRRASQSVISSDSGLRNLNASENVSAVLNNKEGYGSISNQPTDYSTKVDKNIDTIDSSSTKQTVPLNLTASKQAAPVSPLSFDNVHRSINTPDPIIVDSKDQYINTGISEDNAIHSNIMYKKPKQRMLERLLFDNKTPRSSPFSLQDFLETESSSSSLAPSPVSSGSLSLNLSTRQSPDNKLVIDPQTTQETDTLFNNSTGIKFTADLDSKPNLVTTSNSGTCSTGLDETSSKLSSNGIPNIAISVDIKSSPISDEQPKSLTIPLAVMQESPGDEQQQSTLNSLRAAPFVFSPIKSGEYEDISDLSENDE